MTEEELWQILNGIRKQVANLINESTHLSQDGKNLEIYEFGQRLGFLAKSISEEIFRLKNMVKDD